MPWVRFIREFYFNPVPSVLQVFEVTGEPVLVTTPCAKKAKAEGAAVHATRHILKE
jgi:hypothetical protein